MEVEVGVKAHNKAKEEVFLIHGSPWNAGTTPSIACCNTFFLFILKEPAFFLFRILSIQTNIYTDSNTQNERGRETNLIDSTAAELDFFSLGWLALGYSLSPTTNKYIISNQKLLASHSLMIEWPTLKTSLSRVFVSR